jgi:hypothetical protein
MNVKPRTMKYCLLASFICLLLFLSCRRERHGTAEEAAPAEAPALDTSAAQSTGVYDVPIPEPPEDSIRRTIEERATASSVFNDLGCCADEAKRKTQDCCCPLLLERYRKMFADQDPRLADVFQKDPILADCRKKMRQEFEMLENPPKPDGEVF